MSTVMVCQPCNKSFTGPVCYEQHLESKMHKKKLTTLGLNTQVNSYQTTSGCPDKQPLPFIENSRALPLNCPTCNIIFDSLTSFQSHSLSSEHAEKVLKKESNSNVVSSSNCSLNNNSSSVNDVESVDENDSILPATDKFKSQTLSFLHCDICSKFFSGPEPYKQHMGSAAHLKNVEFGKNASISNVSSNNILGQLSCDPCKKIFSGPAPYNQHMDSEIHKKKMRILEFQEKFASEVDSAPRFEKSTGENNLINNQQKAPWFCDVCDVLCSGPAPYAAHREGNAHKKKLSRAEWQKKTLKPDNFILPPAKPEEMPGKSNVKESEFMNGVTNFEQPDKSSLNLEKDSLLPEFFTDSLNVMSSEELKKSIKMFLPGDAIDFDKTDVKSNAMLLDRSPEDSDEMHVEDVEKSGIEDGSDDSKDNLKDCVEDESEVYHVCDVCNVKLTNMCEALKHYESLDHHSKKWKQK